MGTPSPHRAFVSLNRSALVRARSLKLHSDQPKGLREEHVADGANEGFGSSQEAFLHESERQWFEDDMNALPTPSVYSPEGLGYLRQEARAAGYDEQVWMAFFCKCVIDIEESVRDHENEGAFTPLLFSLLSLFLSRSVALYSTR